MAGWTWQAGVGVLGGLGVFALIFVPALIAHYRRYRRVSRAGLAGRRSPAASTPSLRS